MSLPAPVEGSIPTISGHLDQFPLAEFLQTLGSLQRTGKLSLTHFDEKGLLLLRQGRIVGATSTSVSEGLGSLLVERQLVTEDELTVALARQRERADGAGLGGVLLDMGVVSGDALRDLLRERTQSIVTEMMHWDEGRFEFEPTEPGELASNGTDLLEVLIPEGVSVERVIRDGGQELESERSPASPGRGGTDTAGQELQPQDFRTLLETDPEPILVLDAASRIVYANPAFRRVVGKSKQELLGEEIGEHVHPDDIAHLREIVLEVGLGGVPGGHTVRFHEPGDTWRKCYLLPNAFGSQAEERYVMLRALTVGEVYARFDLLTGLLDYDALTDRVSRLLQRVEQGDDTPFAVLLFGINQFTLVNVRYGWAAGNEALRMVADRLAQNLRPGDLMARATGDKFCVVLDRLRRAEDADLVARRIERFLAKPLLVSGEELSLSLSSGVVTSDEGFERADDMLEAAWTSMVDAKGSSAPDPEPEEEPPTRASWHRRPVVWAAAAIGLLAVLTVVLWPRLSAVGPAVDAPTAVEEPERILPEPEPVPDEPVPDEPVQDASIQDAPVQEVPVQDEPVQNVSAQDLPGLGAPDVALEPESAGPPVREVATQSVSETQTSTQTVPLGLELRATEDVWIQVSIDGREVLATLLAAGRSRRFEGQHSAQLMVGNAGGLTVIWNGTDLGRLGATGQVRRLYFTPTEVGAGRLPES